jgi:hypothetical protein
MLDNFIRLLGIMSLSSSDTDSMEKGWGAYPTDLEQYDALALDASACMERIEVLDHVLFSKETYFEVLQLQENERIVNRVIESEEALRRFVKDVRSSFTVM